MREMADSGIDWIPEVPTNWRVMPYKHVFKEVERPARDGDEIITCFRDGEVTLRRNRREDGFTVAEQESGYQHISKGDLVVHGMDGFAGSIGISDSDGKATPVLIVMNPLHAECSRYFMYQLRAYANLEVFLATATGIRVRSCSLNWKKLGNLPALVPPYEEQQRIAYYLDKRCGAIDEAKRAIEAEVDALNRLKKATLFKAVAKGLDDGVSMQNSGIDWIPEVPTNWRVMPYKHVFKEVERPARDGDEIITCFRDGEVTLRRNRREDGFTVAEQESGYQHISKGDLVVHGMDGFAGSIGISDSDGKATPVLIVMNPLHAECSRYFMYQLRAYANLEVFLATATGIRVRSCSLNWKKLGNLPALVPPAEEQHRIADHLDERCAAIDSIIDARTNQLARLEDYRKSLIHAYATGKKEVPAS